MPRFNLLEEEEEKKRGKKYENPVGRRSMLNIVRYTKGKTENRARA